MNGETTADSSYILALASGNPANSLTQNEALLVAQSAVDVVKVKPRLQKIYENTKILKRHLAVTPKIDEVSRSRPNSILNGHHPSAEFFPEDGSFKIPVEERISKFEEVASSLVLDVVRRAIQTAGVTTDEIGQLVVVSSTGFLGPGLDVYLINALSLRRTTERVLVGFMGCAAAMNGFCVASNWVKSRPKLSREVSVLVCVEISSVHTTFEDNVNDAILHAIFSDGCAAAVFGRRREIGEKQILVRVIDHHSMLSEGTEDGIILGINSNGITCTLSKILSQYLESNARPYVESFLGRHDLKASDVDLWGVHPGGTRIIEAVEKSLGLKREQTEISWEILSEYGNMLSPAVMFVIERTLSRLTAKDFHGKMSLRLLAFSFSPGVGIEGVLLELSLN